MEEEILMQLRNKRVLITGGSGFIGSYLAKRLVGLDNEVVVVDNFRRSNPSRLDSVIDKILLINADIKRITDYEKEIGAVDCVFHLAAINGTQNFYDFSQEVLDVALQAPSFRGLGRVPFELPRVLHHRRRRHVDEAHVMICPRPCANL